VEGRLDAAQILPASGGQGRAYRVDGRKFLKCKYLEIIFDVLE